MKAIQFKQFVMAFICAGIATAGLANDFKGQHTKEKTIRKEFNVNADALLKIGFCNYELQRWDGARAALSTAPRIQRLSFPSSVRSAPMSAV